jgi:flavodoxin
MKTWIIYDSQYGNTEKVARAIGEAVAGQVCRVSEVKLADLKGFYLVILGSPTHGGWFTEGVRDLLKASPTLEGVKAAVFDTRTKKSLFGFAAPRIARSLEKNGGKLLAPPEGFIVLGIEGPLKEGELERAAGWAKQVVNAAGFR